MILLDTNILIEIYRNNLEIIEFSKTIGQENFSISDVTSAELLFGARNAKELKLIKKDINNMTSLRINDKISEMAVNLIENYALSHKLCLPDALIAAIAIHYNIELFTLNIKDFKFIKNLSLYPFK